MPNTKKELTKEEQKVIDDEAAAEKRLQQSKAKAEKKTKAPRDLQEISKQEP